MVFLEQNYLFAASIDVLNLVQANVERRKH